jgi:uncharacterized protein (DUF1778 family)
MAVKTRSSRIEARIAPGALTLVKRAADLEGRSVSDFVVAAAHEAAMRTIERRHIIKLTLEEQERLFQMLDNPPKPNAALKRAMKAHRELVRESK